MLYVAAEDNNLVVIFKFLQADDAFCTKLIRIGFNIVSLHVLPELSFIKLIEIAIKLPSL